MLPLEDRTDLTEAIKSFMYASHLMYNGSGSRNVQNAFMITCCVAPFSFNFADM